MKQRRYYEVGEKVWVKEWRTIGEIVKLDIDPEVQKYKVKVKVVDKDDVEIIGTFNLWDINKDKRQKFKQAQQKKVTIPVKYFDQTIEKIKDIAIGDWIDLRAGKDVTLGKFEFALIPLNIAMELPEGYEAHIVPRSSTFKNWGIIQTNSMGVIDNSYAGDDDQWLFPALSITGDTHIKKGDRICQFKIVKKMDKENFQFETVEKLSSANRGGFGSTGKQ